MGIALGIAIAISVFALARAVDRARTLSAGANDPALVVPPRKTPPADFPQPVPPPDATPDPVPLAHPFRANGEKPPGEERAVPPAPDSQPGSPNDRATPFDQELELLRRVGID